MDIFELTERPTTSLFYKSHDPNSDPRIGEIVKWKKEDFPNCLFVILGSPQDEGVKRNNGRPGARLAPEKIREWFYKLNFSPKLQEKGIFDIGNIKLGDSLEETHENQYLIVKNLLELNKRVIILGGGNDISYPDCKAFSDTLANKNTLMAINIDKHFDTRDMKPRNSGTPYRMLLDEKLISPENFVEFGYIPYFNSPVYTEYLKNLGCKLVDIDEVNQNGVQQSFQPLITNKKIENLFWGFDMDAVSSVYAPGVSSSYPVGISGEDAIEIARIAGKDKRSKIFELTEVNPEYDIDNRTVKLSAILIYNFIHEQSLAI